jgi:RND family efflux transporter MFP subunit
MSLATSNDGRAAATKAGAKSILALWATAALLALSGCGKGDDDAGPGRPALTVETVAPVVRDIPRYVPASGAIAAWQEVLIGVELSGLRIVAIEADVGQQVRRGQVLAQLERGMLESGLAQAEAGLTEATAAATEARANADRARALGGRSALSGRETDQLVTASATADARVESAKAQLANARRQLSYTTVVAPDAGIISARSATPGAIVGAGTELFRMIRQGRIEWRAEVPEREYPAVRAGMAAQVRSIGAAPVTGTVRTVSPGLDPATRRGIAYVDVPLTPGIRPGMYVSGTLDLGSTPGQAIPLSAITTRDGSHYVFTLGEDLRVREIKVELGVTADDWAEVVGGLPAGQKVVKSGGAFLRDGDLVALAGAGA